MTHRELTSTVPGTEEALNNCPCLFTSLPSLQPELQEEQLGVSPLPTASRNVGLYLLVASFNSPKRADT